MGLFKMLAGAVGAGGIAVAAFGAGPHGDLSAEEPKQPRYEKFLVLDAGEATGCEMKRADRGVDGRVPLVLGLACGSNEAIGHVRFWRDRPDGTVELSDETGDVAIRLTAADGAAFEAFGDGAPLVTLVSTQP